MSDPMVLPLTEVLDFREGPGIMAVDFQRNGIPLIRLAGLKVGADLLAGCNYLDPAKVARKWSQFQVAAGDVLLSTSASLGEVAVVRESGVGAVPYTGIIRFRPRDARVIAEFIPFALRSPEFKQQIVEMGVGSVMNHFGPSHLKHMTLRIPAVKQQCGIAEVLGALDDKIAANATLVAAADKLAEMHHQAMTAELAEPRPLSSLAQFVNGKAFTKGASGTGRVVIRIAELNSGLGGSTVYNDIEVTDQHLARPGDLLFAWSGSLTVHRWYRPEGIVNQHIFKVIPTTVPMWVVNGAIRSKLAEFKGIAADKATTMGHIQRRHLDETVLIPTTEVIAQHDARMTSLWDRALQAERESLALAELRDTLLPELMSGHCGSGTPSMR